MFNSSHAHEKCDTVCEKEVTNTSLTADDSSGLQLANVIGFVKFVCKTIIWDKFNGSSSWFKPINLFGDITFSQLKHPKMRQIMQLISLPKAIPAGYETISCSVYMFEIFQL